TPPGEPGRKLAQATAHIEQRLPLQIEHLRQQLIQQHQAQRTAWPAIKAAGKFLGQTIEVAVTNRRKRSVMGHETCRITESKDAGHSTLPASRLQASATATVYLAEPNPYNAQPRSPLSSAGWSVPLLRGRSQVRILKGAPPLLKSTALPKLLEPSKEVSYTSDTLAIQEASMITSKLTSKAQTTIPQAVRKALNLHE